MCRYAPWSGFPQNLDIHRAGKMVQSRLLKICHTDRPSLGVRGEKDNVACGQGLSHFADISVLLALISREN
jgi:hypothetical protein